MNSNKILAAAMTTAMTVATAPADSQADDRIDLLDSDLRHWTRLGDANWRSTDGVVGADSGRGFLVSRETFDNYELKLEFYPGSDSNSGVFMRCADAATINDKTCYEANIFDRRPDQSGRTGGIPNYAPPASVIDTENQWNTYEITADGSHITVRLNGVLTVDVRDETLTGGPIALQYAAGSIKFRNVQIRRLP
ncbi:MAG: 3-keto-disaccharide hydrolase [Gammaproteobacteria bacterium]